LLVAVETAVAQLAFLVLLEAVEEAVLQFVHILRHQYQAHNHLLLAALEELRLLEVLLLLFLQLVVLLEEVLLAPPRQVAQEVQAVALQAHLQTLAVRLAT
jgi:hypothetical protein